MKLVNNESEPFPFDELVYLAKHNPAKFEQFRCEALEEAIAIASEEMQPRLRAQQSHLDRLVRRCNNPHQANVVLAQEIHSQMIKMQKALNGEPLPEQSAEIISFSPRND